MDLGAEERKGALGWAGIRGIDIRYQSLDEKAGIMGETPKSQNPGSRPVGGSAAERREKLRGFVLKRA